METRTASSPLTADLHVSERIMFLQLVFPKEPTTTYQVSILTAKPVLPVHYGIDDEWSLPTASATDNFDVVAYGEPPSLLMLSGCKPELAASTLGVLTLEYSVINGRSPSSGKVKLGTILQFRAG